MYVTKLQRVTRYVFVVFIFSLSSSPEIAAPQTPLGLGLVELLAVPSNYEGQVIRTIGFLGIEFEDDALYLHAEDYRYGLQKNSFALRLSEAQRSQFKSLSGRYVIVEGTLHVKGLERNDIWSGAIGNVTRLEAWPIDRGRRSKPAVRQK